MTVYIYIDIKYSSEDQTKFTDFDLKDSILFNGGMEEVMTTNMKLEVSSSFYIHALFTGNYDRGCGFTFNIVDNNDENIFHLDFRLNNKNAYRKVIQSSKFNGRWGYGLRTELPDLAREADIYLTVTDEYFEVTMNNIEILPKYKVNLSRLHMFKGIKIIQYGKCIQFDKIKSYMRNGGNSFFSLLCIQFLFSFETLHNINKFIFICSGRFLKWSILILCFRRKISVQSSQ